MASEKGHSLNSPYESRLSEYGEAIRHHKDKYTLLLRAKQGELDEDLIDNYCHKISGKEKDCDFLVIGLIRLLYLDVKEYPALRKARLKIANTIQNFPFWPHTNTVFSKGYEANTDFSDLVFWSENHIFMMLSSAHLFRQWMLTKFPEYCTIGTASSSINDAAKQATATEGICYKSSDFHCTVTDLEERLLRSYLSGHKKFGGVYEVLSHVYLPFTLCALWNLVDYSHDETIRSHASHVVNVIIEHLLLCTSDSGVATLTASCRAFARTRQRAHGHNINALIRCLTGVSPEGYKAVSITDFLLTTTWRPAQEALSMWGVQGRIQLIANHSIEDIDKIYSDIEPQERVPFYWSAGLIMHPNFIAKTLQYQRTKGLRNNVQLWPLAVLPSSMLKLLTSTVVPNSVAHFGAGQSYANVTLNVYKRAGGLCLTSFELFGGGVCGFQQLPWCCNLNGVAIWTQSGNIGAQRGVLGHALTNTHTPFVSQRGCLLVAAYCTPPVLRSAVSLRRIFDPRSQLFWPGYQLFDEEILSEEDLSILPDSRQGAGNREQTDKSAPLNARGTENRGKTESARRPEKNNIERISRGLRKTFSAASTFFALHSDRSKAANNSNFKKDSQGDFKKADSDTEGYDTEAFADSVKTDKSSCLSQGAHRPRNATVRPTHFTGPSAASRSAPQHSPAALTAAATAPDEDGYDTEAFADSEKTDYSSCQQPPGGSRLVATTRVPAAAPASAASFPARTTGTIVKTVSSILGGKSKGACSTHQTDPSIVNQSASQPSSAAAAPAAATAAPAAAPAAAPTALTTLNAASVDDNDSNDEVGHQEPENHRHNTGTEHEVNVHGVTAAGAADHASSKADENITQAKVANDGDDSDGSASMNRDDGNGDVAVSAHRDADDDGDDSDGSASMNGDDGNGDAAVSAHRDTDDDGTTCALAAHIDATVATNNSTYVDITAADSGGYGDCAISDPRDTKNDAADVDATVATNSSTSVDITPADSEVLQKDGDAVSVTDGSADGSANEDDTTKMQTFYAEFIAAAGVEAESKRVFIHSSSVPVTTVDAGSAISIAACHEESLPSSAIALNVADASTDVDADYCPVAPRSEDETLVTAISVVDSVDIDDDECSSSKVGQSTTTEASSSTSCSGSTCPESTSARQWNRRGNKVAYDEKYRWPAGSWWAGRRGRCMIAVSCTKETTIEVGPCDDANVQVNPDGPTVCTPRRVCTDTNHSWIVYVATVSEDFPSLQHFYHHCKNNITYVECDPTTESSTAAFRETISSLAVDAAHSARRSAEAARTALKATGQIASHIKTDVTHRLSSQSTPANTTTATMPPTAGSTGGTNNTQTTKYTTSNKGNNATDSARPQKSARADVGGNGPNNSVIEYSITVTDSDEVPLSIAVCE